MGIITVLVLVTILSYTGFAEESGCSLIRMDMLCNLRVECSSSTDQLADAIKGQYCTEKITVNKYRDYEEDYGPEETIEEYARQFQMDLKINNVNLKYQQPFQNLADELKNRVKVLRLVNATITAIPVDTKMLTKLNSIEIHTELEVIDINMFLAYEELQYIDLSFNTISVMEMELHNTNAKTSGVTFIDLSHNLIQSIPNKYFSNFPELRHLYLSYNRLRDLDVLAFEGLLKLQTLHFSYNNLIEIGHAFVRSFNLQELLLDNNKLHSVKTSNFITLTNLQTLNMSSNNISSIEDRSFESLVKLYELDLSDNKISYISKTLMGKNENLHKLVLSSNKIRTIEQGAFKGNNITTFSIENNCLTGQLQAETFDGIHVQTLDLSKGNLTVVEDNAFSSSYFQSLNISFNAITTIKKTAFGTLDMIEEIDLSNNFLKVIEFEMVDSSKLSILHAKNNYIEQITTSSFKNLSSLSYLDLSHNFISHIEPQSFINLRNLATLALNNNPMPNTLQGRLFEGLSNLTNLNLAYSNISCFENYTFSGLSNLQILNASHGDLINLTYNAFMHTESIEVLDLSHNMLQIFQINTTTIKNVKEIQLNNNQLTKITNESFAGLHYLLTLNLAENNIVKIDQKEFQSLIRLSTIDLSLNTNLQINGSLFNNLGTLTKLNLTNVKGKIDFEDISNTSIEILDLSQCNVINVHEIFLFKIASVVSLNLSRNKITYLDKYSFQIMPLLAYLDLSNNLISYIQPGTFIHTNQISSLNLHGNELPNLQFGVLDGLRILRSIDLSDNALHLFENNILHSSPMIDTIILDNNALEDFNFKEFSNFACFNACLSTKVISIGGNEIPCHVLTNMKKMLKFDVTVTAEVKDYHTENVNGIKCRSNVSYNNTKINSTNIDAMLKAIENVRASIEQLNKNINSSLTIGPKTENFVSILKVIDELVEITNVSQEYFKNLNKVNINTNDRLIDIIKILNIGFKNLTDRQTNNFINNSNLLNDGQLSIVDPLRKVINLLHNLTEINIQTNNHLRNQDNNETFEKRNKHTNGSNDNDQIPQASTSSNLNNNGDIKGILCFIAVCLAINIVGKIYKHMHPFLFPKHRPESRNNLHDSVSSAQPIVNVIEMH